MVEIVSQKPKISLPTWQWPLWVSAGLFLLSIIAFAALKVYLSQLQAENVIINNQIKVEAAKINANDADTMARLSDSLGAFNKLIPVLSRFSNVLDIVGSITYQRVVFTKFDANREKNTIQLKGTAQNYTALAKQIVALRENKNIKGLEIKGINFGDKGLDFEISADVEPQLFIE